jgi:hypothetical protein
MMAVAVFLTFSRVVITLVAFVPVLLPLYCILDAATTPSKTFRDAGSSKALWIVLLIWLNLFAVVIYLASIRPRLRRAQRSIP